jgi:SAM-dependent methyltransferase
MATVVREPGSFRDPDSRVFHGDDGVYRILSARGLGDWQALAATPLLAAAIRSGRLVETELVGDEAAPHAAPADLPAAPAGVLRHARIPFVSYPYEWSWSMLRDAALLQLDLLGEALEQGLTLKDATPYNVQWRGARPQFVDVGSFEPLREGEPWVAYRQFCTLFLNPLLLQALTGVPFQPWLRGSLEGIAPAELAALLRRRDRLRRGVLTHVVLHARLERRHAGRSREVRRELRSAGFGSELIRANVAGLRKLLTRLDWRPPETVWTAYERDKSYSGRDEARKDAFVRAAVAQAPQPLRRVWDLGANTGRYSRIAAEHADCVLAVDSDQAAVELLYRELRDERSSKIVPLVVDLASPSPALGWRGRERMPLERRGRPDLTLALAVVHHLSIAANVPLREVVEWLAALGGRLVVEFPHREDPMVQTLLAGKRDGLHADYERHRFEQLLDEAFLVERRETLASGTRTLYLASPRGGAAIDLRGRGAAA